MRERIYYDEKEQRVIVTARALASFAANGRGIPFENTDTSGCITDSGVCVAADLDRTLDGLRVCGTVEYVTESPLGFAVVKTVRGSRRTWFWTAKDPAVRSRCLFSARRTATKSAPPFSDA